MPFLRCCVAFVLAIFSVVVDQVDALIASALIQIEAHLFHMFHRINMSVPPLKRRKTTASGITQEAAISHSESNSNGE